MQEHVNPWSQTKELIDLHEINLARATRKTEQGKTLAWVAAQRGNTTVLERLTKFGSAVELNQADDDGVTPTFVAAQEGHADALRVFIEAKTPQGELIVDRNRANNDGVTPALIASENGHVDCLRVLMETKTPEGELVVELNQADKDDLTPAFIAAQNGHIDVLQFLMEARRPDNGLVVDFNKARKDGVTPIHVAIIKGHLDVVILLLEANVDLTCLYNGMSPLQLAEKKSQVEIAAAIRQAEEASPDASLKP